MTTPTASPPTTAELAAKARHIATELQPWNEEQIGALATRAEDLERSRDAYKRVVDESDYGEALRQAAELRAEVSRLTAEVAAAEERGAAWMREAAAVYCEEQSRDPLAGCGPQHDAIRGYHAAAWSNARDRIRSLSPSTICRTARSRET